MIDDPRLELVEVCHLLAARNFTTATGGNVSVQMPDGSFWVTPSGLHKARVQVADLVHINSAGDVLDGTRKPSSETFMHLMAYQALPKAGAIIHAHPPYATGFAVAGKTLDTSSCSEAIAILGPEVPLIPYAHPSTLALAEFTIVEQAIMLVPEFENVVSKMEQQVTLRGQSKSTLNSELRSLHKMLGPPPSGETRFSYQGFPDGGGHQT